MRIEYEATSPTQAILASINRTEDLMFSPDGRRLAIACFQLNQILILEASVADRPTAFSVEFSDAIIIESPSFVEPHGVAWLDDDTIVVASRGGLVPIIRVPKAFDVPRLTVEPLVTIGDLQLDQIFTPGCVSAFPMGEQVVEILICNSFANRVTRHLVDTKGPARILASSNFLTEGLNVPDGVAHSKSGRWVAVSSHYDNCVFIYQRGSNGSVEGPVGVLSDISFPHGLRFARNDTMIVVADAGSPDVRVFLEGSANWSGKHLPKASVKVMDDETFSRGHTAPEEGGPKGVAISDDGGLLLATFEQEPVVIMDIRAELRPLVDETPGGGSSLSILSLRDVLTLELAKSRQALVATTAAGADALHDVETRAAAAQQRAQIAETKLSDVKSSTIWRLTTPLRRVLDYARGHRQSP